MAVIYQHESKWQFFNLNKIRVFYRLGLLTDFLRGTDFYGAQRSHPILDGHQFTTAYYPGLLSGIFKILPKQKVTGIIDIGSGKGLGIVRYKRAGIPKVGGIEYQSELVEICKQNLQKLKIQADLLYCGDAQEFREFSGFNTLYLYNALPCDVLEKTLSNFLSDDSTTARPHSSANDSEEHRALGSEKFLISVNPVCHETVLNAGFVEMGRFFHFATHDDVVIYRLG